MSPEPCNLGRTPRHTKHVPDTQTTSPETRPRALQPERTSWKKTLASCPYSGDLKAKSVLKVSQQLRGVGPLWNSHVVSRWSNSVLSLTREITRSGGCRYTSDVYLHAALQLRALAGSKHTARVCEVLDLDLERTQSPSTK